MPDEKTQEQQTQPNDLLEQLLVVAAERAAKEEADQALKKGYVTREQINMALDTFGVRLQETLADKLLGVLDDKIHESVKKAVESDDILQKAGVRRSTIVDPLDERDADPITYLIKKGRVAAQAGQDPDFDDVDKRLMWAVTETALSQGMLIDQNEE